MRTATAMLVRGPEASRSTCSRRPASWGYWPRDIGRAGTRARPQPCPPARVQNRIGARCAMYPAARDRAKANVAAGSDIDAVTAEIPHDDHLAACAQAHPAQPRSLEGISLGLRPPRLRVRGAARCRRTYRRRAVAKAPRQLPGAPLLGGGWRRGVA